jgi:hypothetical protein
MPVERDLPSKSLEEGERELAGLFALGNVRGELEQAKTPAEINRVRLHADALRGALDAAVKEGSANLAALHTEAERLALDAVLAFGRNTLVADGSGLSTVDSKALADVVKVSGVARTTARRFGVLALAHRVAEAEFDALVDRELGAGKPVPYAKLRAMAKPPKDDAEPEEKDPQVAFRLPPRDAQALDTIRGEATRTEWARQLVIDVVGYEPKACAVHLIERALDVLDRAGPKHAKVIERLEAEKKSLERDA